VHKLPSLIGFETVVEPAKPIEQVEKRYVAFGPVKAVVTLQEVGPYAATFSRARREQPVEG